MKALIFFIISIFDYVCFASPSGEKILLVTAEQTGIFNTGGLGHTTAGLARALKESGEDVDVIMPYYSTLEQSLVGQITDENFNYRIPWGYGQNVQFYDFRLYSVRNPKTGVNTFLLKAISHPELFDNFREAGMPPVYTNFSNEGLAFGIFNKVTASFVQRRKYTLINAHDWHAGLLSYYMREYIFGSADTGNKSRKILFTISNLGYQGLVDSKSLGAGAPDSVYMRPYGPFEFYGRFNFMKAGIANADVVLTVSPGYLKDIKTPRFGHGLDGFIREQSKARPFISILNGADIKGWVPTDFSAKDLSGKTKGKLELQKKLGLFLGAANPLFCLTSRLANQKGYDYLPGAIRKLLQHEQTAQVIVMGDGEINYIEEVRRLQAEFPFRMIFKAFDKDMEVQITRYSDFFVNAAWYEPSGTNQIFAMANGTVPILSRTGGLPDYIEDRKSGLLFDIAFIGDTDKVDSLKSQEDVGKALITASTLFKESHDVYVEMSQSALTTNHQWDSKIPKYRELFRIMETEISKGRKKSAIGRSCKEVLNSLLNF